MRLIDRQSALNIPVMPKEHRKYRTHNLDDVYEDGWNDALACVGEVPTVDAVPIGEEFWLDRFNIWTRGWRDANGNLMGVSFVITRKEAEDERPD